MASPLVADDKHVLDDEALENLYAWIDSLPLSRPKRNIARDFADGVMVAEIVAHYLPKIVEMHNFISASGLAQKRTNWNTLNRKVFAKMGLKISEQTIMQLVEARQGAIEQVLWDLRRRLKEHPQSFTGIQSNRWINKKSVVKITPNSYKELANEEAKSRSVNHFGEEIISSRFSKGQLAIGHVDERLSRTQCQQSHLFIEESETACPSTCAFVMHPHPEPPRQIVYKGVKMIPMVVLEKREEEWKQIELENKGYRAQINRMEALIGVKNCRIEDLSHELICVRADLEAFNSHR